MGKINIPSAPTNYTTQYTNLRGVDFSQDASLVNKKRSPNACNLISDEGGNPCKRLGWRTIYTQSYGEIYNIWKYQKNVLVRAGDKLILFANGTPSVVKSGLNMAKGFGVPMQYEEVTSKGDYSYTYTKSGTMDWVLNKVRFDHELFLSKGYAKGNHTMVFDCYYDTSAGAGYRIENLKIDGTSVSYMPWTYGFNFTGFNIITLGTNGEHCTYTVSLSIEDEKNNKLYFWFSDGYTYWRFDGTNCVDVSTIAKRPKVLISRKYGKNGGGTSYEDANILTGKRTISFLGDETEKDFYLPYTSADAVSKLLTIDEVRTKNSDGQYVVTTAYTSDLTTGKISFTNAQPPIVEGEDNIEVDFTINNLNSDKIAKCTVAAIYGYNSSNRIFYSGNSEFPSTDWYCEAYDPTYISDLSYSDIGSADSKIVGYSNIGGYLGILKENENIESTIFLRNGYTEDNEVKFATQSSIAGVGAVNNECIVNLIDEPLFLSTRGIMAITTSFYSSDRMIKNRSYFVNRKLTSESNLENACACEWNGYYVLAVNNHAYILDSRHSSGNLNTSDYSYEAYYWDNIPAKMFLSNDDELWFVSTDNTICKFNTDVENITAYSDGGTFDGAIITGGTAIDAYWSTPNDDDGGAQYYKTLLKKGGLVVLAPYRFSSAEIYLVKDGYNVGVVSQGDSSIFDFGLIDFERFVFDSSDTPREIYFNKKEKKYKRLQIIIRNNNLAEGFGIHEIIKTYNIGNFSK